MTKRQKTGGRQKGSKNKRTIALDKAAQEGKLPLEYMLEVMRDPKADNERRDDMARAAAPYLHARRAPEDNAGNTLPPMLYVHPSLEDDGSDGDKLS
jgi:hypothetical protein